MKLVDRFVVVDDDSFSNLISKLTITKFNTGATIQLFTEPEIALGFIQEDAELKQQNFPIVLLLDINMPQMSGWEFLEVFKDFEAQLKEKFIIYILSSSIDNADIEKAENNPLVSGFISKPLTTEALSSISI